MRLYKWLIQDFGNISRQNHDKSLRGDSMIKLSLIILSMIILTACSSRMKQQTFATHLAVGMKKSEVENILGRSWDAYTSKSGNGEINHAYSDRGYVWYNQREELAGFASFVDIENFSSIQISRARGYKFSDTTKKSVYLVFQPFSTMRSNEAKFVFLENRKHIEMLVKALGYRIENNSDSADILLFTKLGISDPNVTQELVSTPQYNLQYVAPQQATTNIYGANGSYLGSATSSSNPYGSLRSNYAGQNVQTITNTTYIRSLEFVAVDKSKAKSDDGILWSSIVSSVGASDDIKLIFPYLLYASKSVLNKSATYQDYAIAGFHTGVFEIVGIPVRKAERTPAGELKNKPECTWIMKFNATMGCSFN